jgi:calcineurin-like phosphoesterase
MRILFIGDVIGRSGRAIVQERLPGLIVTWKLDFVVINGENAAGGFGITEAIYGELLEAGADAITLGNHAWDQREALVFIERAPRLIRPLNFPPGTPGRGVALSIARRPARNRRPAISATAAPASSSARTRMYRPPITASCPAAPPSSPTSA